MGLLLWESVLFEEKKMSVWTVTIRVVKRGVGSDGDGSFVSVVVRLVERLKRDRTVGDCRRSVDVADDDVGLVSSRRCRFARSGVVGQLRLVTTVRTVCLLGSWGTVLLRL